MEKERLGQHPTHNFGVARDWVEKSGCALEESKNQLTLPTGGCLKSEPIKAPIRKKKKSLRMKAASNTRLNGATAVQTANLEKEYFKCEKVHQEGKRWACPRCQEKGEKPRGGSVKGLYTQRNDFRVTNRKSVLETTKKNKQLAKRWKG